MAHGFLSKVTGNDVLEITTGDAKTLAVAVAEVNKHYDVPLMSPKAQAWAQLGIAAAGIYGPMVVMAMAKRKSAPTQVVSAPPRPTAASAEVKTAIATIADPSFVNAVGD